MTIYVSMLVRNMIACLLYGCSLSVCRDPHNISTLLGYAFTYIESGRRDLFSGAARKILVKRFAMVSNIPEPPCAYLFFKSVFSDCHFLIIEFNFL